MIININLLLLPTFYGFIIKLQYNINKLYTLMYYNIS